MSKKNKTLDKEALSFHSNGRPGKLEISATKPLTSQHDLSLAYSPGVAAPCLAIEANPNQPMTTRQKAIWSQSFPMGRLF